MASYRNVVALIDNWQAKSDEELVEAATSPHLEWFDPEWWTSWGVAGCIGAENVTPMLNRLRATPYAWVADAIASSKAPFGDASVNAMMLNSGDPDMIKIAQATRRLISLCESQGLANDGAKIIAAANAMRLEELKKQKLKVGATRWNAYNIAIENWDGNPNTEPPL